MRLVQLSSILIQDVARKARRVAIVAGILAVCIIAIAVETIAAARLALEPAVGPVWARLVIAGAFAVLAGAAVGAFVWADRRASRAQAARAAHGEDPRAAIIAEAISLGYALGRDFMKATAAEADAGESGADGAERKPPANGAASDERRPAA